MIKLHFLKATKIRLIYTWVYIFLMGFHSGSAVKNPPARQEML